MGCALHQMSLALLQSYTITPYLTASATECIPVSLQVCSIVERCMSQVGAHFGWQVLQGIGAGGGGVGSEPHEDDFAG